MKYVSILSLAILAAACASTDATDGMDAPLTQSLNEQIECKIVDTAGQSGSRLQKKTICITEAQRQAYIRELRKMRRLDGTATVN